MSVKLYEIAQAAGVSISTVSRVLNHSPDKPASKETSRRIMEIAYDLGYFSRPDMPNQSNIAKVFSDSPASYKLVCFLASASDTFHDPFFSGILSGIQKEAIRLNYTITHTLSTSDLTIDTICSYINDSKPDGIILMGRVSKKIMQFLNNSSVNIVYAGLNKLNCNIDQVICDGYTAILEAVNYLTNCGFTKIGYIGTIPVKESDILNEHRFQAFSDGLKLNNLALDMDFCKNITLNTEQAYCATEELLQAGKIPDAFCCANDNVAFGVISALNDYQYRVPKDVSVIGLDDIELSQFMRPRLTTFNMQTNELGKFAVKVLDDRIKGYHSTQVLIQLPSSLIIRDSCMPKNTAKPPSV